MDHKTFEKLIPDFLDDYLDNETLRRFLQHYASCPDCREELSIQYLIKAGLPRLETGDSFNLEKDLAARIEEAKTACDHRKHLSRTAAYMEVLAIAVVLTIVILIIHYVL